MNALGLLADIYGGGVRLTISGDEIRVRAPRGEITEVLRRRLAEHKQEIIDLLGSGTFPAETLPAEIYIPSHLNTVEAISACIDAQKRRAA